jgi:hypothetical protein
MNASGYRSVTCSYGYQSIPPGWRIGGWGNDIDAVWIPGGRRTQVSYNGGPTITYDRRGLGGFCLKVNDLGAWVGIY